MKMIKKAKKGFTLIELVVVIAVIAILSGVSVVAYVGITNNARKSAALSAASEIVMVVKTGVLADADGYYEADSVHAIAGYKYHVQLVDRELKFSVEPLTGTEPKELDADDKVLIIEDMISELKETGLKDETFIVREEGSITQIGVLVKGTDADYQYASF